MDESIRKSRLLFGNPYAFLNGDGEFDAALPEPSMDEAIHQNRLLLGNQYAFLNGDGALDGAAPKAPINPDALLEGRRRGDKFSKSDIATIVRNLQTQLWQRRASLVSGRVLSARELLDPALALSTLGFVVEAAEPLGEFVDAGDRFEVAGVLDRDAKVVRTSSQFPPHVRTFTLAHELGHAVLHQGAALHRDRALDGSNGERTSDSTETAADHFAVCFLMPEKLVRRAFRDQFCTEKFVLDGATAFALRGESIASVRANAGRTLRTLSRCLASIDYYDGAACEPLASQFRVSVEAMAIRLEELGLVSDPASP